MIDLAVGLYAVALVLQLLYWAAAPSAERARLLFPVIVVGALTIAKAWPTGLDHILATSNISDIIYTVLCVVSVATTHFFVSSIPEPHVISRRAKIYHYSALAVLVPGTIYQWISGPNHVVETSWDASDWQVIGHWNWLLTVPCRLYITVGVAAVGFTLRRYAFGAEDDPAWRIGLLCMSVGVELAAAGNVSTITRMFIDPALQPYQTAPGGIYQYLTDASYATQYTAVAAFAVGISIPRVPKAALRMQVRSLQCLWSTLDTVFPGRSIVAQLQGRGEELQGIAARQVAETIEGLGLVFLDKTEQHVVSRCKNQPAQIGRLLARRGITAQSPSPGQISAGHMLTRGYEVSKHRRRVLRLSRAYNRQLLRIQVRSVLVKPQLRPTTAS